MPAVNPGRPERDEYLAYYDNYIGLVPEGDITSLLEQQISGTVATLVSFSEAQAQWRPAPGEWNAIEIVGHVADMERVFAYRALAFARTVADPLPGVDQDDFMAAAGFANRSLADVVEEFVAVRRTSLALFRSLDEAAWFRQGVASDNSISVRALAYLVAGHELHHARDFPRHRAMGE